MNLNVKARVNHGREWLEVMEGCSGAADFAMIRPAPPLVTLIGLGNLELTGRSFRAHRASGAPCGKTQGEDHRAAMPRLVE
ncbi:MAG TPA: hypothetical protein VIG30_18715 [Ktedonobacterales bacterium]